MPHTKSSKKDLIRIEIRTARNKALKSRLRTAVKTARQAIVAEPAEPATAESLKAACRTLDKMVTKGLIHKNQASRKKSRLVAARKKAEAAKA